MRLYQIHIAGAVLDWAGTQADAKASAKQHQAQISDRQVEWAETDVPTDKPGLIAWLKANATQEVVPLGEAQAASLNG
jgi:hypothetical protein